MAAQAGIDCSSRGAAIRCVRDDVERLNRRFVGIKNFSLFVIQQIIRWYGTLTTCQRGTFFCGILKNGVIRMPIAIASFLSGIGTKLAINILNQSRGRNNFSGFWLS